MNIDRLNRTSDWSGVRVVVAGFGVSGFAAADNLLFLGATVTALDDTTSTEKAEKAQLLETLGATIRLEPGATATQRPVMIQKRITMVTCSQPSISKWWCSGVIRKTR